MKNKSFFGLIFLILFAVTSLNAQLSKQTGTINGVITDEEGFPLPGVNISVVGPKLLGKSNDVSRANGSYVIRGLPPGTYTMVAELSGFQTVKNEQIEIHVGRTIEINVQMKPGAINEEVTVVGQSPIVDVTSEKTTLIMTTESLTKLPLNRSVFSAIAASPGTFQDPSWNQHLLVHGGTGISNTFDVDGLNSNWAADYGVWFSEIGYDSMEELEIITGGIQAEETVPGGALINVVTKSGGNEFHGQVQGYYTRESLNQYLFPQEHLKALGLSKPAVAVYDFEPTAQLGGPIIKDKLWFFTDVGIQKSLRHSGFIETTILGKNYEAYDMPEQFTRGFLKLSAKTSDSLRFFVMGSYIRDRAPNNYGGAQVTKDASYNYKDVRWKGNAAVTWLLSNNTFIEFRSGASGMVDWMIPQPGTENNPDYYDWYTGYSWGTQWRQRHSNSTNWQNTVDITHFQDNFLGANHEFKAGLAHQFIFYNWPWFRKDPLDIQYYNGSPYVWRELYGLSGPHPTLGDAPLYILYCGPNDGDTYSRGNMVRLGGFIQDTFTFKNRLTINLGVRYDNYRGYMPAADKKASAGIAKLVGDYALTPVFGFNALDDMRMNAWNPALQWGAFSPRAGFSYDLFGNSKTAVKGSFSVYTDFMSTMYFDTSHPFREWSIGFNWWDLNGNQEYDAPPIDRYEYLDWAKNPREFSPDFYKKTIAPNVKSPLYWEYTFGVDHELLKDWSVGLKYIYKYKTNTVDTVYYDPVSQRNWYTYEQAPDWWIPFKTIVPETGDFPEQEATMYFMSANAPQVFYRFQNVPEAKRRYNALQFMFDKRMSDGWSLGGSVVLSRTTGNNAGYYGSVWGYGEAYDQPNWWVNKYGRTDEDTPFALKIYGSFQLPYRFIVSFIAQAFSGRPFQRTVTVYPPAQWAVEHNAMPYSYTINVETQGKRRNETRNNVDFRLEKEFPLGKLGKFGVFLDIFNLFGDRYLDSNWEPGGTWFPDAENTNKGSFTQDYWYGKVWGTHGQRIFKFSARFTF